MSQNETTSTGNNGTSRKPDLIAYNVRSRSKEKKDRWTEIGVAFKNRDGSLGVLFDAVPLSGKIVLRAPEPRENS